MTKAKENKEHKEFLKEERRKDKEASKLRKASSKKIKRSGIIS